MKKLHMLIAAVSILWTVSSCDSFIEEPYDNRVEIKGVEEMEAILVNAYPLRADIFTEIMTDNFHHYASTMQASNGATYIPIYLWRDDYSSSISTGTPSYAYSHYYKKIYEANNVIEGVESVSGSRLKKQALLGEALMLRA